MRILFYFSHPAQYLCFKKAIHILEKNGHEISILLKTKDVLEHLVKADGYRYRNISKKERRKSLFNIFLSYLHRIVVIAPIVIKKRPKILIGTDASIAFVGRLLGIHCITITEDDYRAVKYLAILTYSLTKTILCPDICDVGRFGSKKTGYSGYMKLGYLHPAVFTPNPRIASEYTGNDKYVLIRLSGLKAYHDFNIRGLDKNIVKGIINIVLKRNLNIYISSEYDLPRDLNEYRLRIKPEDFHHILAQAEVLISDSQSLSVEGSVLGIPNIRYSDFAGRISVLEELEKKYELTFGIKPIDKKRLIAKIDEILSLNNYKEVWQKRRERMLKDKINLTPFLVWFIENYPHSRAKLISDPLFQERFK